MSDTIAALMKKLSPDQWRVEHGFSSEMKRALEATLSFRTGKEPELEATLNEWIRHHQPCLFGRIAAKQEAITYCLISEESLYGSEEELNNCIRSARLKWTRAGFEGKSSNFIIAVLSETLALAVPDETVKSIARRLCSRYLQESIEADRVYHDRIWLKQETSEEVVWEWLAGVNYFSAQGDGRWWQDHRFPAGIAFSVNSVGHMVKAGRLARALNTLEETMETAPLEFRAPDVHSLEQALAIAMSTINRASMTESGKATHLVPLKRGSKDKKCPIDLPKHLSEYDCSEYRGFYHTDYTIPSEYFRSEVLRPIDIPSYNLDFTYLFLEDLDNPDFDRMGKGRRIRQSGTNVEVEEIRSAWRKKRLQGLETEVRLDDIPELKEALASED